VNPLYQRDLDLALSYPDLLGVDEAGRGALAGPVVVAAVRLDYNSPIEGLNDSKLLSPRQREGLYRQIVSTSLAYHIVEVGQDEIDRRNILAATLSGMAEALLPLADEGSLCLIDGNCLPDLNGRQLRCVVRGDTLHACIAAASILAKVHRDALMRSWHSVYPLYGFDRHKGYGTRTHLQALFEHGACPLHRRSFHPVSSL
jgi:ribonuclease HII